MSKQILIPLHHQNKKTHYPDLGKCSQINLMIIKSLNLAFRPCVSWSERQVGKHEINPFKRERAEVAPLK